MRRFISSFLVGLLLANLSIWPSAALAEVLEHEQEVAQSDGQTPAEPNPAKCSHGCIGHYGQHFQWQVPIVPLGAPTPRTSLTIVAAPDQFHPQNIPSLPFRPPLHALIRS